MVGHLLNKRVTMQLPDDIKAEIVAIFAKPGEELSDGEINEIAKNLLGFALDVSNSQF